MPFAIYKMRHRNRTPWDRSENAISRGDEILSILQPLDPKPIHDVGS